MTHALAQTLPPEFLSFLNAQLLVSVTVILAVIHIILGTVAYLIYVERKAAAYASDRIGPNRVGFDFGLKGLSFLKGCLGLGQPLADGLKFLLKEDYAPKGVDIRIFTLAPIVVMIPALLGFAIIPWGGTIMLPETITLPLLGWQVPGGEVLVAGAPINVGILYLVAVTSLGVYGILLGGWASNNKYTLLGSLRASAQMLSYEIPLGLCILVVLLMTGSLLPAQIISYQLDHGWLLFAQPIAAVIFFIAILAESNRVPFDNAESENDLVGGYHTEYSAMRFALFFLAEYAHVITSSAFFALLFLGGWQIIPGLNILPHVASVESHGILGVILIPLLKFAVYFGKVVTLVCLFIMIRWTLPRLRFDQVMHVGWQGAIPLSLALVVMTAVMIHFQRTSMIELLAANALILVFTLLIVPLLPRSTANKRIPLAGSRFSPLPDEAVATAPAHPLAREDRPVEGTLPVA